MARFAEIVVRRRKLIIIAYLLIIIPCIAGYLNTAINYDLLSYMPDDFNSKQGELLLEEEFGVSGLGLIMVRGKENWEIKKLAAMIEGIAGVEDIVWLGDFADIHIPRDFISDNLKERFISGDSALLQVQFTENARSEKTGYAVRRINEIISGDEEILFGGAPAVLKEMQTTIDKEMLYYIAVAVVMIFIILTLSVRSYLDPLLFMLSVGVAVAINLGTNIFQGEISFITASIAAVMQLGISLDYAIFLMHRFEEEKEKHASVEKAMEATIIKTATVIASSALTTVGGFAALMVMQNGIGRDMGLVLGKGIIISLFVNLTFLPGLILVLYKLSSRFQHRILLPSFTTIAGLIIKSRWVLLILFFLLLLPSFLAQNRVEYHYSLEHNLPETAVSVRATASIIEEFGSVNVIYVITENKGRVREYALVEEIKKIPQVGSVFAVSGQVDPAIPESVIPTELLAGFQGKYYRYFLVFLTPLENEQEGFKAVDLIRETAGVHHAEYFVTGSVALTRDMASLTDSDARNVAIVSLVCIALIIACAFKSLSLPLILIAAVQLAIWINLSLLYFRDQAVSSFAPMMIGAIQLGATVDYAILFAMRYRENIFKYADRAEAARQTIVDSGRSILTSALTLFSATVAIALIAGIRTTGEITMLISRGAAISMLIIFMGLPALLILFEKFIRATTMNWAPLPAGRPGKTIEQTCRKPHRKKLCLKSAYRRYL